MDDELMWAADRVVSPNPGPAIIIPETANEFAIKGNHLTLIKGKQFDGRIKTDPHKHIHEFLCVCDEETKNEAVRLMMFPLSLTGEAKTWLDELNKGTIESWDELRTAFISHLNETTQEALKAAAGSIFLYKTPNQAYQLLEDKVLLKLDWAKNQKPKPSLKKTIPFADEGSSNSNTDKIMARMDVMTMKMDAQYKEIQSRVKCNHCGGNHTTTDCNDDDTPMSREEEAKFMQTIRQEGFDALLDEEEYFNALLDDGSKILYFIEGTLLEDQIFAEFDEFMVVTIEENSESDSKKEGILFEKITFDTDFKIKKSLDEPPTDLEFKPLPDHLEYAFLEEPSFLPVIISSQLSEQSKNKLIFVLKKHKQAFAWKTTDNPESVL
ncbi:reverse transcriptase domain-containing protein [Tanacetum coccineum]